MATATSRPATPSNLPPRNTGRPARSLRRPSRPWMMTGALVACTALGGLTARPAFARTVEKVDGQDISLELWLDRRFPLGTVPSRSPYPMWQDLATTPAPPERPGSSLAVTAEGQDAGRRRYGIPAGPLEAALSAFQAASGVTLTIPSDLTRGLTSFGVSGTYTADQALVQVLRGTSLTFRFTAPFAATLEIRIASEAVEVSGRVPRASSPTFTQPLRDTPQTVTIIPQTVIEAQGATSLRDVLRNVPGITIQAGEGGTPAGDQMTIRGFSARTDLFIDGVRDFGGYSRDSFNLEQVEVTKGPASATMGRGSTGGSVNLVSKAPTLGASRQVTTGVGSGDFKRVVADINQPITGIDGAAVRLNVLVQDAGVDGRDVVDNTRWGLAPSLALGLGTPTAVTMSYFRLGQSGIPDYGLPWVPAANIPLSAHANQPPPIEFSNFYGMRARDYEKTTTDLGTVVATHEARPGLTLRNQVRYGRTGRDSLITAPRFVSNTSTDIRRTDWKSRDQTSIIAANQADVTARFATGGVRHALVAGVDLAREVDENRTRVETGPPAPDTDLFHPNPDDAYTGSLVHNGASTKGTATTIAPYAFDTVSIGEQWELSGGARWDSFGLDYESVAATGVVTPFERTDRMVSWRAGAVFKPRPNASIYTGAGTSLNPSAEGLALSASTVGLEPEKTRNYEAGTKWDLLRARLSLTAAIFRTEKTNARTPGINPGDPPTVLEGRQRVNGVETSAAGRLTPRWEIYGGYSFMSSTIVESNTPADLSNDLTLTPRHSFNLWSTFRLPWETTAGAGAQFMDAVFRNTANTTEVPSYWLFNAMAARDIGPHLTLRLNAANITDEQYVDRVGGGHFIPGAGRSVSLTAGFQF
jgi:catecholate siderophore receptor